MGRGKPLTAYEKGCIDGMASSGLSNRQIAAAIHRSANVVNSYIKDRDGYGRRKSTGRPPILSTRNKRAIRREIHNAPASVKQVMTRTKVPGSWWTTWRAMRSSGNVEYYKGQKRPAWKDHHKTARMNFAVKHVTWTTEWSCVAFSDEKKWNLDGPDGCHYYWHDLRHEPQWFKKRGHGGGSIMTWGAFGVGGRTQLMIVSGRINSDQYQALLSEALLPAGAMIGGPMWMFQQDNAPIHVSHSTKAWLQDKGVRALAWPALSPDLNPIENLWGIMVRRVYANGRQFDNVQQLKQAILAAWESIDEALRLSLVSSMHSRCVEVIKSHGGTIPY